jgi:membrane fusion protein, macrolide-specific efflux system
VWSKLRHVLRNPFVIAPLVALVAVGIWLGIRSTSSSSSASGATVERVVTATRGTLAQTVSASGTIEPETTDDLSFSVPGTVTAVNVKAGDAVTAGQVLATVDSASLASSVAQAQATVDSDAAKVASDTSADASSAQLSADESSLTSARSQLAEAQAALADASLTSPIAGTVSTVNLTVGQQLGSSGGSGTALTGSASGGGASASSSSSSSGGAGGGSTSAASSSASSSSAEVEVVSTGTYVVNLSVDDTEIAHIAKGDQATVTPSGGTTSATGTVTSVGAIASSSSGVSSFPVVVTVSGNPTGFYGGDSATVAVIYQQVANAIQVPVAAVTQAGGQSTVTLVVGGRHVTRTVTTGTQSNGEMQVTRGVSAGDQVVVEIPSFGGPGAGTGRTRTGTGTGGFEGPGGATGSGGPPSGFGGGGFGGSGTGTATGGGQ